jgi:hypothetical protein
VNADERQEIAASVAAHAELGPRYDGAVAEGLVERIGEEIDRRVDARLRGMGQHEAPRRGAASLGQRIAPPGYQGSQHPMPSAPLAPPPVPAASPAAPPAVRHSNGVTGMFLGLGSMAFGLGATAVVVSHHVTASAAFGMVLLIWVAIAIINIAHAQRR